MSTLLSVYNGKLNGKLAIFYAIHKRKHVMANLYFKLVQDFYLAGFLNKDHAADLITVDDFRGHSLLYQTFKSCCEDQVQGYLGTLDILVSHKVLSSLKVARMFLRPGMFSKILYHGQIKYVERYLQAIATVATETELSSSAIKNLFLNPGQDGCKAILGAVKAGRMDMARLYHKAARDIEKVTMSIEHPEVCKTKYKRSALVSIKIVTYDAALYRKILLAGSPEGTPEAESFQKVFSNGYTRDFGLTALDRVFEREPHSLGATFKEAGIIICRRYDSLKALAIALTEITTAVEKYVAPHFSEITKPVLTWLDHPLKKISTATAKGFLDSCRGKTEATHRYPGFFLKLDDLKSLSMLNKAARSSAKAADTLQFLFKPSAIAEADAGAEETKVDNDSGAREGEAPSA